MKRRLQGSTGFGRDDGQASALTVLLPLRWWGLPWLRASFFLLRFGPARRFAYRKLDRLEFVSAIRWSLLPPFDRRGRILRRSWWRTEDQCHQLLFESNFDGDWDEYLENFASVASTSIRWVLHSAVGYPGIRSPQVFKAYARLRDNEPARYESGYQELSSSDVRELVFQKHGIAGPRSIARDEAYGLRRPRWSTFLLPLKPGRVSDAIGWSGAIEDSFVEKVLESVHFLRIVPLARPAGDWLLVTMTHEGDVEAILPSLVGCGDDDAVMHLLACCVRAPDSIDGWSAEEAVELLLDRRQSDRAAAYCAYAGFSPADIRSLRDESKLHPSDRWPARR